MPRFRGAWHRKAGGGVAPWRMARRGAEGYIDPMSHSPFSHFRRGRDRRTRQRRFRAIPVRTLVPNLITLLALCAGLTAIRLAVEGKLEWALGAIVLAAVLDGLDGRVARLL